MTNNYELSLTPENYADKFDEFYSEYGNICDITDMVPINLQDEHVRKCANEVLFHDIYAIADKEKYAPNYQFQPSETNISFRVGLTNCGLIPDPSLASSGILDSIRSIITRIVLWVRSFSLFNSHAHEACELLSLYSKVKAMADARLQIAKVEDCFVPPALINMRLGDFEWSLYSMGHSPAEKKEVIFFLTNRMHSLRGQVRHRTTEGLNLFEDNEEFLTTVQMPLRELMFLRQRLFIEIVDAAENYPLFGRAKSIDNELLEEHRNAMEDVLAVMRTHYNVNSVSWEEMGSNIIERGYGA